jgi:hypothetical protein
MQSAGRNRRRDFIRTRKNEFAVIWQPQKFDRKSPITLENFKGLLDFFLLPLDQKVARDNS